MHNMNTKRKRMLRKKAQLEMIGLMMIVIIVIVGLLIFLVYKLTTPTQNVQKRYIDKEIATNMLITLTNTHVKECHDRRLSELIVDCVKSYSAMCGDQTPCEVANKTIFTILNNTLVEWDISFNLSIKRTDITFSNLGCGPHAKAKERGFEIIPLNPGYVEMILDICGK